MKFLSGFRTRTIACALAAACALPLAGLAQLSLGLGGGVENQIPVGSASVRLGALGFKTGLGYSEVSFVEQGHRFYTSAVYTSGMFKLYLPSGLEAVTPYLGAGGNLLSQRVDSVGETFPSVTTLASGLQGELGLEALLPWVPVTFFASGTLSTLDASLHLHAGGRQVVTQPLMARRLGATLGLRFEFGR